MRRMIAIAVLALTVVSGCRGDDGDEASSGTEAEVTTTTISTAAPSLVGEATVTGPLAGGEHGFPQTSTPIDLAAAGYVEEEFLLEGEATSYRYADAPGEDGVWGAEPADTASYTTRILVRRPEDPTAFNGTVVVEWFNVSSNVDVDVDFGFLAEELLREGYAWVGVSAQEIGVTSTGGGQFGDAAIGLQAWDQQRYGDLSHPGDAYSYDIFSQAGAALRTEGGRAALGGLVPDHVLADGESQSAFRLLTYVNAVDPLAQVFDGFLIHSRDGGGASLGDPAFTEPSISRVRTDGDAPVLQVVTETDLFALRPGAAFPDARQPDGDRVHTWEVAGTAHADADYLELLYEQGTAQFEGFLDLRGVFETANQGPQTYVMRAALRALRDWVTDGTEPPSAEPIDVADGAIVRDEDGNALGGVRTPPVDVPVATLTGEVTPLIGNTTPFTVEELVERYGTEGSYLDAFAAAIETAVSTGFILEEDVDELRAEAGSVEFS
jgi:hypothetical protein